MKIKQFVAGTLGIVFLLAGVGCKHLPWSPESRAKKVVKNYFIQDSKTPATIQFQSVRVFDQKDSVFFIQAVFDEQNTHGALLRQSYCVTVVTTGTEQSVRRPMKCPEQLSEEMAQIYKEYATKQFPGFPN